MPRFTKRFSQPGTAPGTLQPRAPRTERVVVKVFSYDADRLVEKVDVTLDEAIRAKEAGGVTWIEVEGVHETDVLQRFGDHFGLHSLALEDVVNTGQRPKLEDHDDYCFLVLTLVNFNASVEAEQVSLFLGRDWVVTFHETPDDAFDLVRERLRKDRGKIRAAGADYLAYALIDALVDHFFPVLEKFGERIEVLEDELVESPTRQTLADIHAVKRELLQLRRVAWPQREVISALERHESDLIRKETRFYLRDCYDHTIQIMDVLETYRDLASGMMDLYLSSVSNRMNEVMKVLTVMASIFIPLTFLAGVYGMNFNPGASPLNMPELNWYWGYPVFWLMIVVIGGALLWFFKRKGWL